MDAIWTSTSNSNQWPFCFTFLLSASGVTTNGRQRSQLSLFLHTLRGRDGVNTSVRECSKNDAANVDIWQHVLHIHGLSLKQRVHFGYRGNLVKGALRGSEPRTRSASLAILDLPRGRSGIASVENG